MKTVSIDLLVFDYTHGGTIYSVAEKHGVSHEYVRKKLHARGVIRRCGRPGGLTKEQEPLVIALYKEGNSLTIIGRQFNVTNETIRRTLALHEVERRSQQQAFKAAKSRRVGRLDSRSENDTQNT